MKRTKIAISMILACAMALSLTACFGGGKLSPSKLAKAAKAVGAEEYEPEDFADEEVGDISKDDLDDYTDGIYTTGKADDIKKALKSVDFYEKGLKEASIFFSGDYDKKSYSYTSCLVVSFVFDDKEDSQDYYDDMADILEERAEEYEDYYDKCEFESDEDGYEYAILTYGEKKAATNNMGIYHDGKTILIVYEIGSGSKDLSGMADSICEEMGIKAPSEAEG